MLPIQMELERNIEIFKKQRLVTKIDCSNREVEQLPRYMNFPNLQ